MSFIATTMSKVLLSKPTLGESAEFIAERRAEIRFPEYTLNQILDLDVPIDPNMTAAWEGLQKSTEHLTAIEAGYRVRDIIQGVVDLSIDSASEAVVKAMDGDGMKRLATYVAVFNMVRSMPANRADIFKSLKIALEKIDNPECDLDYASEIIDDCILADYPNISDKGYECNEDIMRGELNRYIQLAQLGRRDELTAEDWSALEEYSDETKLRADLHLQLMGAEPLFKPRTTEDLKPYYNF